MYEQLPAPPPGDLKAKKNAGLATPAELDAIVQWLAPPLPTAEARAQTGSTFADETAETAWLRMQERSKRLVMNSVNGLVTTENTLLQAAGEVAHFTNGPGHVTLTTLSGQTHAVGLTLNELEAAVDALRFFRANPSALVARAGIAHTESLPDGCLRVLLKPAAPAEVVIPQTRTEAFRAWFGAV